MHHEDETRDSGGNHFDSDPGGGLGPSGRCPVGSSELETEKVAVTFARETARGGYQIMTAAELKAAMDQKKDMLIVDTMPFEASFRKNHIPGAVNFELPVPEMTTMDDRTKESFEKLLGRTGTAPGLLLRIHYVHAQPQRRDVGGEAGIQECLPPAGRHQGLDRGKVSGGCCQIGQWLRCFAYRGPLRHEGPCHRESAGPQKKA